MLEQFLKQLKEHKRIFEMHVYQNYVLSMNFRYSFVNDNIIYYFSISYPFLSLKIDNKNAPYLGIV